MAPQMTSIIKRNGEVVPYTRSKITDAIYKAAYSVGGHDRALSDALALQVEDILTTSWEVDSPPSVEEVNDIVERVLIENGHARTAKAFILYRAERTRDRARQEQNAPDSNSASIPYQLLYHVLNWNIDHGCDTIEGVNQHLRRGTYPELVQSCDATFESDIGAAARQILERGDETRVVIIAGPSSSGKTTTTAKLAEYLRREGRELVALNVDNYYYDLEVHPQDEHGDYDFEGPQALDLPLINEHLEMLLDGRQVEVPRFDFPSGKRLPQGDLLQLEPRQLILIDSLHGLFEGMTRSLDVSRKFRLYIETLAQIRGHDGGYVRWTDIRLMRRMVRDNVHRNYDPVRTVGHWHYVRRAELKYIVPFINRVDFRLNSALPYELPALKRYVSPFLPSIVAAYENDSRKTDAFLRAQRLVALLDAVETLQDETCIPETSLLREFIGGGIYGQ